ncbi:MAG TPA: inositol monophosphatase family protein [Solirubrobacteraceae bacterium]|nr:inositol monophosphatase family protein [Solirubrobacteraceae bacterium]
MTTQSQYDADLQLAFELADAADAITMARYRAADLAVETKPDLTPVSESDKACELALRELLAAARPDDAVIGEEFGGEFDPSDPGAAGRAWVIDPIDGTKSYVRGMDTWTTLIALFEHGEVKVGLVSMPALSKRWWAVRGQGAYADGRRIHVSQISALASAQFVWSGIEEWDATGGFDKVVALGRRCWRTRGVGDSWQYMLVAEGAAEIATDPEATLWDLAAVSIVVEEAGGRFTGLDGTAGPGAGSGLASNGPLHADALAALGR